MDYQGFIETVARLAGIPLEQAGPVSCLTLHTLAQRISTGELEDLAPHLPPELRQCIEREGPVATFDADEFLRRLEEHTHTDRRIAEGVGVAVLAALWTTVGPKEFHDLCSQLTKDFGPLVEAAELHAPPRPGPEGDPRFGRPMSYDEFVRQVAVRAATDLETARKATEAVLETLAMRVTAGQINDLRPRLPRELHPALDRGMTRSHGQALPLTLEEFVREVTAREGISTTKDGLKHAQAVLAVLREAVGEKEFQDTNAQLPDEYRVLVAAR
ncbi:DUF2267 domain-containing protein [Planosporangium flavigriseum]|uniref:DUF2267 domain-containing protein n=1 Tax=Planosporangium flavigriseum TaxID=373681 RepID=A0A8J3M0D6_9ACTN|nr:DUF2267 domain-containing protein [Planosporangium flavigriseum]NJC66460.1 DUF2267 domain-containing protein [Planosporangium flavigriseum]GIG76776.1 hypothetical protein Pfl04_51800 [Planosporangium flavigriseum]